MGIGFRHQLGFAFAQGEFPKVITILEAAQVVEGLTVGGHYRVRQIRRIGREPHNARLDSVKFHLYSLILFLIGLIGILTFFPLFGITLFPLLYLLLGFFGLFKKREILFRKHKAVACLTVEEHNHYILLRTPRRMVAHAVAVGEKQDGVPVKHEPGI